MRKNSPRKWLHACLDLLPILLIPVFMIYSHRHTLTEQAQAVPVYQTKEVNGYASLQLNTLYKADYFNSNSLDNWIEFYIVKAEEVSIYHESLSEIMVNNIEINNEPFYFAMDDLAGYYVIQTGIDTSVDHYVSIDFEQVIIENFYFYIDDIGSLNTFKFYCTDNGTGITESDFNVYEIEQGSPNIMNVFMDSFNSSIDRYFNMGNVFNLSGVYDWFNNNIFNGNAPQVIYSVWNIALYELVMDLLFLLYGLFMWFIDMVQHIMDKPFKSVK